uniref:Calmodulin n=1 Tax=Globodera rostochiensis TaxID=31243 RepID=A0A914H0U4_GLORO
MSGPQMAGPQMSGPQMSGRNCLFCLKPQMSGPQMWAANPQMSGPQMAGPQMSGPQMSGPQMWAANVWAANVWAANAANVWAANVWAANVWAANVWAANVWAANVWAANCKSVHVLAKFSFCPLCRPPDKRDFMEYNPPKSANDLYQSYDPMVGIGTAGILLLFITLITAKSLLRWTIKQWRLHKYAKRREKQQKSKKLVASVSETPDNSLASNARRIIAQNAVGQQMHPNGHVALLYARRHRDSRAPQVLDLPAQWPMNEWAAAPPPQIGGGHHQSVGVDLRTFGHAPVIERRPLSSLPIHSQQKTKNKNKMDLIIPIDDQNEDLSASRRRKRKTIESEMANANGFVGWMDGIGQKLAESLLQRKKRRLKKSRIFQIRQFLPKCVPITQWLPVYSWRDSFFVDLCAGLTAAVFSIPTGIAHAGICGVAPVYGLYTVIFPTFFYMLFGHSRHNALGGFAILSLMTRAAIEKADRMLVIDLSMPAVNQTWPNNNGSTAFATPVPPYKQQLLNDDQQTFNDTLAIMNSTLLEDGTLNTLIDENSLNTSMIIAELNSTFDSVASTSSNPLLSDPIQLSVANTPIGNSSMDSQSRREMRNIKPIHIATAILFLSGIFQILMGIFRLDFLSCYFSDQVMSGFVLGGCVHVFFSQIGDMLGIQHLLPKRSGRGYLYERILDINTNLCSIHLPTTVISFCSIAFLVFTQQILEPWLGTAFQFPIPYELLLVIIGITSTNFADLSNRHSITVVGNIPTNFPPPSLVRYELVPFVFFDAIGIAVTAVAMHLTVVKIVENRYHYKINSCQELYSLGLSGICSSAFPVFPITSIFARTLIGDADENSTQMTTCFSTLSLLTVILYIGPVLEYLPKCILASIVMVSICTSFTKFRELRELWPLFKIDFVIFLVSFLLTVCYDIAEGLTFSALFSAFTIVVRDQWPKWHFLTHDEELDEYREMPKELLQQVADEGHAFIIRYDAPLIFTSVHKFMKVLLQSMKRWEQLTSYKKYQKGRCHENALIIDCSGFPYVDFLGLRTLKKVYKEFSSKNVDVKFAAPKAHLTRMFRQSDFFQTVPEQNVFQSVRQAVNSSCCRAEKLRLDQRALKFKEELYF